MSLQDTLLKELTELPGVSGDEEAVRKFILKQIKQHVDDIRIDSMGNIIATKNGTGQHNLRVMVAAHMDEVGFIVVGADGDGYLRVKSIGGIDNRILPALRVEVGKDRTLGFFSWKPIHLNREKETKTIDALRIDIGADSKSAALGKAPLGTRVTFASETIALSDNVIRGKAFDDRAGCANLIELCKGEPLPFDLIAVFTVQEEVGLRGAKVVGERVRPDAALILETTACHELPQDPDEPDFTTVTKLGEGPVIYLKDRTTIPHPGLLAHFRATAEKLAIPYQYRSPQFAGGTDAGEIHISIGGIPAINLALPSRYIHSPYSILNLNDFQHGVQLARQALMDLTPANLER